MLASTIVSAEDGGIGGNRAARLAGADLRSKLWNFAVADSCTLQLVLPHFLVYRASRGRKSIRHGQCASWLALLPAAGSTSQRV